MAIYMSKRTRAVWLRYAAEYRRAAQVRANRRISSVPCRWERGYTEGANLIDQIVCAIDGGDKAAVKMAVGKFAAAVFDIADGKI